MVKHAKKQHAVSESQTGRDEEGRVAIGLNCIKCGIPLQIGASEEAKVLASLRATGLVWLVCVCGQLQLVEYSSRPRNDA